MVDERGHAVRERRLWVLGEMGAGKSTIGRAVASVLAWPYFDNDAELTATTGRTLLQLEHEGAESLHGAEREVARVLSARSPPLVASLAASVADDELTMRRLRGSGRIAYLDVPDELQRRRVRGT